MTQGALGTKKPVRSALGRGLSALVSTPTATQTTQPETRTTPEVQSSESSNSLQKAVATIPSNTDTAELQGNPQSVKVVDKPANSLTYLPISKMRANPSQPRRDFSDQEIAELSDSIKVLGVLQPIIVRPMLGSPNGTYQIIAGERRFRASIRAGLSQVPVIIKDLGEKETLEVALVENIQRQGLNPIEEALGYQKLMDEFSLTTSEVAERVGKDRATVANIARLLKLPEQVQHMVRDGRISTGHAKAILTVREPNAQINLANKIVAEALSVRAIESIVARDVVLEAPKKNGATEAAPTPTQRVNRAVPHPELEERLRNVLGTKVTIQRKRRGGSVEIHFFSDEELDRLVQFLAATRE